jgi:hypothetical protein
MEECIYPVRRVAVCVFTLSAADISSHPKITKERPLAISCSLLPVHPLPLTNYRCCVITQITVVLIQCNDFGESTKHKVMTTTVRTTPNSALVPIVTQILYKPMTCTELNYGLATVFCGHGYQPSDFMEGGYLLTTEQVFPSQVGLLFSE